MKDIIIVGGGLAGCEAAWHLANKGYKIKLYEMRPHKNTPAHTGGKLAELVCSNSLKSNTTDTAAGLLKAELRLHNSLLIKTADETSVPAGSALAVDREIFAQRITTIMENHPKIEVIREEITSLPETPAILTCGPLASDKIVTQILTLTSGHLSFVDAISPVISTESIDLSRGFFAGRYGKGGDDYLNLPMSEEEFNVFYDSLVNSDKVKLHDFEDEKVFEKCMPIEVIASRGKETLLFGPMRPVGLEDPVTGKRFFAVVQLRLENKDKTAYNIVGFQTKMTIPAQKQVLRLIPGLENAEFLRYGTIHRNTYIDAPEVLNVDQSFKKNNELFIAGQITGVEGYLESMASGIMAAIQIDRKIQNLDLKIFHQETAFGALQRHISGDFGDKYTPSNFHFGMLPPFEQKIKKKADRKTAYSKRALDIYSQGLA